MSENYCVFWYPTIFHQEKVPRDYDDSKTFIEISDKDNTEKNFYLKVKQVPVIDKPGCNHLSFLLADRKDAENNSSAKVIKCEFHYCSHTRNGFVTYTYDREKLKKDYWDVFLKSEDERTESISQLKIRVRDRIIKKYKTEIPSGEDISPSDDLIKDYVIDRILISFYHYAKGFYHEHEVQSQSDGKLKAYYYSKEYWDGHRDYLTSAPTLSTKNNEVINWYLDQFEQQFISYAERVSKDHRDFSKRINLRRRSRNALDSKLQDADEEIRKCLIEYSNIQKESVKRTGDKPPTILSLIDTAKGEVDILSAAERRKKLDEFTASTSPAEISEIHDLHKKLRALSKLCGDALTEYTYCKALLGSKYNDDYKYDRYFDSEQVQLLSQNPDCPNLSTLDERRKKAFNIRNSIRYIEGVKQNCSRWESELTENLIDHVRVISINHEETLRKVESLSKENKRMLEALEKSNMYSSFLGLLGVGLGLSSFGFALLTLEDKVCKLVGLDGNEFVVFGIGFVGLGLIIDFYSCIRCFIKKRKR